MSSASPMDIASLLQAFASGALDPARLAHALLDRASSAPKGIWISLCSREQIDAQCHRLDARKAAGEKLPLYGIPFAIKDNIDFEGLPTTAACPAYSYMPEKSATAVQKLCDAGAIAIGKTNLDQFAAGLVGTRSPYGVCPNAFNPKYISGGSSSGSAVAVANGTVSFALGTDTAGSGRVPAGFNNIVGLKPTRGLVSAAGVVPACKSLDCVSVFSLNCEDASTILKIIEGFDPEDAYSRPRVKLPLAAALPNAPLKCGVPKAEHLKFFGDVEAEALYRRSIESLVKRGAALVEIDYEPFLQAAALLYGGAWVAERYLTLKDLLEGDPNVVLPVTRSIIERGRDINAVETFRDMHFLERLRQRARAEMSSVDLLLLPTTGTTYTIEQVLNEPIATNTSLGYYTNFVNFFDLCAVSVPSGFREYGGVPLGVTLIGPAGAEAFLLGLGDSLHRDAGTGSGISRQAVPNSKGAQVSDYIRVKVAVLGAHLSGMPLNHQMTDRKATLIRTVRTAPKYRFYALPGTVPPKPGLVRVTDGPGASIELEVWEMPAEGYGTFVAAIPAPLGIGTIELEDGSSVQGFLCESYAVIGAADISSFGGWRAYMASLKK